VDVANNPLDKVEVNKALMVSGHQHEGQMN